MDADHAIDRTDQSSLPWKIFIGQISAQRANTGPEKGDEISTLAVAIRAKSKSRAYATMEDYVPNYYPLSSGWRNHQIRIDAIPEAWYIPT